MHSIPTPRLGGLAIFAAVIASTVYFGGNYGARYAKFVISMLPIISVGFWEDMVRPTTPRFRILAIFTSTAFTILTTNLWINRIDFQIVDIWLSGIVGIAFTAIIVAGVVNAVNMIDGLNGLCGGISLAGFVALNSICQSVGYDFLSHVIILCCFATLGFLLFNFPFGRIFLGDAGAYTLGYLLVWSGISLIARYGSVSPWAIFLILSYPIYDMVFTIGRRAYLGKSPFSPDRMHLHHILHDAIKFGGPVNVSDRVYNPLTSVLLIAFAGIPMYFATIHFYNVTALLAISVIYGAAYIAIYFSSLAIAGKRNADATQ
jgi:UDP-N-acetylmuramyl pentapeptide phosphotransferase/UDP-N-acetylglucosamine-1-phosphate transferase